METRLVLLLEVVDNSINLSKLISSGIFVKRQSGQAISSQGKAPFDFFWRPLHRLPRDLAPGTPIGEGG